VKKKKQQTKRQKGDRVATSVANVKVVGIGGGGTNAVSRMAKNFVRGVDFIAINTDHQDLDHCEVRQRIYIGRNLTRGLGTGMNPDLGRQAAEENRSEIAETLRGADLVFIAAGLGGGTGGGAAPIVAEAAKQNGALTVAVVTKPFGFEGNQRERVAQESLGKLRDKVDALIVVPNDRIFAIISKETPLLKAFEAIDDVLKNAVRGIVELIAVPGIINVDYADVRAVMQDAGGAVVSMGIASGADRAVNAVNMALNSPLLETSAEGAKGILLGVSGGRDMRMNEINEAAKLVAQVADPGARIIFGAYHDKQLRPNQIKVMLVATGFNGGPTGSSLFGGHHFGEVRTDVFGDFKSGIGPYATPRQKPEAGAPLPRKKESPPSSKPEPPSKPHKDGDRSGEAKEEPPAEPRKKEADIWDIPTFLRRKKR